MYKLAFNPPAIVNCLNCLTFAVEYAVEVALLPTLDLAYDFCSITTS